MSSSLEELLRVRFDELGVDPTQQAWAEKLGKLDKGTFSRILAGTLTLTEKRARKWADLLYPGEPEKAAMFSRRLFESARESPSELNVSEFFEDMVARGGVVPADRMDELLKALVSPDLQNVLVCCEYRDLPRAAPDTRYENLASALGRAIAEGVHFAMFQPFGRTVPLPTQTQDKPTPALNAALYMLQIKTKCIDGFEAFRAEALGALKQDKDREKKVLDRLNLYERGGEAFLGSGFQGKLFYIRYSTADGIRHERILQWLSTPLRDVLVYRGQREITPEAVRDSFYPIPHFFDAFQRLPHAKEDGSVRRRLKERPGGAGLPGIHGHVWYAYA